MTTELGPIAQIHLSVTDIARALTFYRDVLRLPLLLKVEAQKMASFDCAGIRLDVGEAEPGADVSHPLLHFRVADIDEAYAHLQARGAVFEGPPHLVREDDATQLWRAFFRDPDGTRLAVMEERAFLAAET